MKFLLVIKSRVKNSFGMLKNRGVGYFRSFFSGNWRANAQKWGQLANEVTGEGNLTNQAEGKIMSLKEELFSLKRPKSLKEYYSIGRFMLSKRLGNILFILTVLLSIWFIIASFIPSLQLKKKESALGPNIEAKSYFYDAHKLKNYTGMVRVFSKKSKALFEGSLTNGIANGPGTLYDKNGNMIFKGDFKNNRFNGDGTAYYTDGSPHYIGGFLDNFYSGNGELRSKNGQPYYIGGFIAGLKNGRGTLYNNSGNAIFDGMFTNDMPNLSCYIGATMANVSDVFLGKRLLYNSDNKVMVSYPDVDCVLVADKKQNSVDEVGTVRKIFIMAPSYYPGTSAEYNRLDLGNTLPKNFLNGFTNVSDEEMSVIDVMRQEGTRSFKGYESVEKETITDEAFNLKESMSDDEFYISKYKINGFIYTFYFTKLDGPYVFYSIERLS